MNITVLFIDLNIPVVSKSNSYLIGVLIALFILAYLVYSLVKPEKF